MKTKTTVKAEPLELPWLPYVMYFLTLVNFALSIFGIFKPSVIGIVAVAFASVFPLAWWSLLLSGSAFQYEDKKSFALHYPMHVISLAAIAVSVINMPFAFDCDQFTKTSISIIMTVIFVAVQITIWVGYKHNIYKPKNNT